MKFLRSTRSLNRLLILMGLTAAITGGARLWLRHCEFLGVAEAHASRVEDYGVNRYAHCWREEFYGPDGPNTPEFATKLDALRDHYARLEAKYRRAACYPWLNVEPDPPLPVFRDN